MELTLGPHTFGERALLVMAIVNRTPDSFYDQGATYGAAAAMDAVDRAVAEGADIVDIGGVKAGHGVPVSAAEEIDRTAGFVGAVRARHPALAISVDTWRSDVAEAAVEAGADLINDAWGGADPRLASVAARTGAGLVCTHVGDQHPRTDPHRVAYDDVMRDVLERTLALARQALDAGVRPTSILIDPAHDFGKNTRHSLEITRRLDEMVAAGWPVLVSVSNKDFVGETLDLPVAQRLPGTLGTTAVCAWQGARVFRAHHVRETRQVIDMVAAIRGTREPAVARRGLA